MVRYERFLDYASLRVLLNGQDISEQFRVSRSFEAQSRAPYGSAASNAFW